MPPSSSSVTTPARDNEDLLVLSREPADTKRIASQSPALECSKLKHRRAGHQQGGPGWGLKGVGGVGAVCRGGISRQELSVGGWGPEMNRKLLPLMRQRQIRTG